VDCCHQVSHLSDLPEELQTLSPNTNSSQLGPVQDPSGSLRDLRSQFEKMILEQRLEKLSYNVTKAADSLGIERAHLHRKMKQYGIIPQRGES
jgi:two-component system nitrogen regulation response regulator NtrX